MRSLTLILLASTALFAFQGDEPARHMESAKRLLQQQSWRAAAGEFELVLKSSPKNVDAYIGLGVALRVADLPAKIRGKPSKARNEINQMPGASGIDDWLPSLNVFRTFPVVPPPEGRLLLAQIQNFVDGVSGKVVN